MSKNSRTIFENMLIQLIGLEILSQSDHKNIIDVGCASGRFTIPLGLASFPFGSIIAIDPMTSVDMLRAQYLLKTSGVDITLLNVALSDSEGPKEFHVYQQDTKVTFVKSDKISMFDENYTHTEIVETTTLDLLRIKKDTGFVKIDAEGCDLDIVRGGYGLIDRCRPVIIVEKYPDQFVDQFINELLVICQEINYTPKTLVNTDYIESSRHKNILLLPNGDSKKAIIERMYEEMDKQDLFSNLNQKVEEITKWLRVI